MKVCKYQKAWAAQRYVAELAQLFPKRQFKVAQHPYDFAYTVAMYDLEGSFVAYVSKRKRNMGLRLSMYREGTERGIN